MALQLCQQHGLLGLVTADDDGKSASTEETTVIDREEVREAEIYSPKNLPAASPGH
jgi:hypothetical protein